MSLVMNVTDRLDDLGKPAWIAVMVLAFIIFWPVGLAILAYLIWSGRMRCYRGEYGQGFRERRRQFRNACWGGWGRSSGRGDSGNTAFENYKEETLRRLEEEQAEFMDFLYRLRNAKDKAEFDQFMAERRNKPKSPPEEGDKNQSSDGQPS